jgi:1-acyl-sn-glycerol-3-phosphate acyltransferase
LCSPLVIEGLENFDRVREPCLIVPNHTSHFDTIIVLSVLPGRVYERTAVAAAADRFYRRRLQGLWFSLLYNTFPITRGGGRGALEYSTRLLREGWSL